MSSGSRGRAPGGLSQHRADSAGLRVSESPAVPATGTPAKWQCVLVALPRLPFVSGPPVAGKDQLGHRAGPPYVPSSGLAGLDQRRAGPCIGEWNSRMGGSHRRQGVCALLPNRWRVRWLAVFGHRRSRILYDNQLLISADLGEERVAWDPVLRSGHHLQRVR